MDHMNSIYHLWHFLLPWHFSSWISFYRGPSLKLHKADNNMPMNTRFSVRSREKGQQKTLWYIFSHNSRVWQNCQGSEKQSPNGRMCLQNPCCFSEFFLLTSTSPPAVHNTKDKPQNNLVFTYLWIQSHLNENSPPHESLKIYLLQN